MSSFQFHVSEDNARLTLKLSRNGEDVELDAKAVDELIRALAERRAAMTPVHSAEPPKDPGARHAGDNLLWNVRPAGAAPAIEFAVQHPGLGWIAINLSRAQAEDLVTEVEFSLNEID